jgi:DNA-binding NarL/FixJ family response regulator
MELEAGQLPIVKKRTPAAPRTGASALSQREVEILAHIAGGHTNAKIARDLYLSPKTVMHHSTSIYRKLEVRGRAEAVATAYRTGLLQTSTSRDSSN